jgi:glycosyltransferase involved in cell wall biosynthesis
VVRIIARLNVGGPARQACLLHERLSDHLDTWLVYGSLAEGEHDMSHLLSSQHQVVRLTQLSREISVWSDARAFWRIFRLLRRERPDIVHTHTAKAGAIGRLAAWLTGVPVIVHTYHGHVFRDYFGPTISQAYLAIERMLGRVTTGVIAISESQLQDLSVRYRVVPPEKIFVIQNGFELECGKAADRTAARKELGIGADDWVVAWVGRLVPIKDVELLARMIQRASAEQSKIRFLVVGDGTEKERLESLIHGCGNARLLGWRRDMAQIWSAADAALLTSRNEGTPTALIEAMAAGLPFVATHVGAVQDLAVQPLSELPGQMGWQAANGFLAERTPGALLYCIEKLAAEPQLAARMASIGRAFALNRFSAKRLLEEMTLLYQTLLARGAQAATVQQPDKAAPHARDAT